MNFVKKPFWFSLCLLVTSCSDVIATDSSAASSAAEVTVSPEQKNYLNYEVLQNSVIYHYIFRSGVSFYLKPEEVSFEVEGADPKTFKELTYKYAQDDLNIYHKGHKLRNRDVATFRIIKKLVTADKSGVYLQDKIIKNSDGLSFKFIGKNYALDNNQAYYLPSNFYKVISDVDPATFTELDGRYAADKNNVYYTHLPIKNSKPESFEILDYGFSKDSVSILFKDALLEGADYASFSIIGYDDKARGDRRAQDKNNVYSMPHDRQGPLIVTKKERDK